jgi:DNA polymerase-3 subunit delta'
VFGPEGSGTPWRSPMQYILCGNQNGENNGANQSCNLKFQKYHILIYTLSTVTTEEVKKKQKY